MPQPDRTPAPTRHELPADERLLFEPPSEGRLAVALVYPGPYRIGMSSLALHVVWRLFAETGAARVERAFTEQAGHSLESARPLSDFDVVAFTSSYEPEWHQLPRLLSEGGVAPLAAERGAGAPLVLAGGAAITMNPEPVAPFVDAAVLGEGEDVIPALAAALAGLGPRHLPGWRRAVLETIAPLPGVYVPSRPEFDPGAGGRRATVCRLIRPDLDTAQTVSAALSPHTVFADRFLVEVGRGCGRGCRFCLACRLYAPTRVRSPERVIAWSREGLAATPRIGLLGAALSDYPGIDQVATALAEAGAEVSTSSVRIESVSRPLLRALARGGQRTITLAPETGTEALRAQVAKPVTDEQLFAAVEAAAGEGLDQVRLYFMVGLPGETDADAAAIGVLVGQVQARFPVRLHVTLSPFVPKPHTPLQDTVTLSTKALAARLRTATRAIRQHSRAEVGEWSARWAAIQAVLSRGGRELAEPLLALSGAAEPSAAAYAAALALIGVDLRAPREPTRLADGAYPWAIVGRPAAFSDDIPRT